MKVGFLGVQCDTANLGLAALAYSSVLLVRNEIVGDAEFVLFSVNAASAVDRMQDELGLDSTVVVVKPFRHKSPRSMIGSIREMASCDVVVDFTGGDSFSDIYGLKRLWRKLLHKQMVLISRTPLLLAPQTYGPVQHRVARPWFRHVVRRAADVYTRDDRSAAFLDALGISDVTIATDVAVTLPWDPAMYPRSETDRVRVGVNVSGLLWNGGYTRANQFGLTTDYQRYCRELVDELLANGYEVHLVPHVLTRDWESTVEDDVRASASVHKEFPATILAPAFASPIQAKSYIAQLDAFVGSRMHATIASFSSGVPTVPVAYSRKFKGFFGNLGYDILVDLASEHTSAAVELTLSYLADRVALRKQVQVSLEIASNRTDRFRQGIRQAVSASSPRTTRIPNRHVHDVR